MKATQMSFGGPSPRSIPVTMFMIVAMAVGTILTWAQVAFMGSLVFTTQTALTEPWGFVTYFLYNEVAPFSALLAGFWAYSVAGTVEQDTSSKRFAVFSLTVNVLSALCLWLGSSIMQQPAMLTGIWTWLTASTVAWGSRYPNTEIRLCGIIPVKAKWIAVLSVATVLMSTSPKMAIFAALPLALVWAFATDELPIPYSAGAARKSSNTVRNVGNVGEKYFDEVRNRERQREEKERLRKLFEASMIDNEPDENRKLD